MNHFLLIYPWSRLEKALTITVLLPQSLPTLEDHESGQNNVLGGRCAGARFPWHHLPSMLANQRHMDTLDRGNRRQVCTHGHPLCACGAQHSVGSLDIATTATKAIEAAAKLHSHEEIPRTGDVLHRCLRHLYEYCAHDNIGEDQLLKTELHL